MRGRSFNRRAITAFVSCIAALAIGVPTAFAGYDEYVQDATFAAGSYSTSHSNVWEWNRVSFYSPGGGLPQMGLTYVRPNGTIYDYYWSNTGSLTDLRTISYGQARCKANQGNGYNVYIFYCDTGNYG